MDINITQEMSIDILKATSKRSMSLQAYSRNQLNGDQSASLNSFHQLVNSHSPPKQILDKKDSSIKISDKVK